MKKILAVALIAFTTISVAQESVKLRLNYKKGDVYVIKMNMNQNMSVMSMNMKMDAKMEVTEIKDDTYISEMQFTKIDMGMLQGGMQMAASTDDKEEDLDAMGKQLKGQLDQMLTVTITSVTDELGKVIGTKAEPNLPGMEQMTNQTGSVNYPEKALRVGDSWTEEKTEQGVISEISYTIKSISKDVVEVDLKGDVSGVGTGDIAGNLKIDPNSGVPTSSTMETNMTVQGQDMKVKVSVIMEKMK